MTVRTEHLDPHIVHADHVAHPAVHEELPAGVDVELRWQRRRLSVRPGLTCIWQISGRSNVMQFEDWMAMDLEYIDNYSLPRDLKILLRTIPAVLKRHGAY